MGEITAVLRPADPAWDGWLDRVPRDFHHGAAYHAFSEQQGEGRALLFVHGTPERFFAWPLLVNRVPGSDRFDASSVYGYCGPLGRGLEPRFLESAWSALREAWTREGLVTLFTRFHPVLANHLPCGGLRGDGSVLGGELLRLGNSVSIDLGPTSGERRAGYGKVLRQEIAAAERAGLEVVLDDGWRQLEAFGRLYRETMAKNRAEERYQFSHAYLEGLRDALQGEAHLAVARVDGVLAGALLFTVHGGIAQAHLTGTDTRLRKLSPLKALIDGTAELARGLGARLLHLGAGRGGRQDSLFDFKGRFGSLRHDFVLGRWILDAPAYRELCGGTLDDGAFFPAYRAPQRAGSLPAGNER